MFQSGNLIGDGDTYMYNIFAALHACNHYFNLNSNFMAQFQSLGHSKHEDSPRIQDYRDATCWQGVGGN